jgi:hypothetical protein
MQVLSFRMAASPSEAMEIRVSLTDPLSSVRASPLSLPEAEAAVVEGHTVLLWVGIDRRKLPVAISARSLVSLTFATFWDFLKVSA